MFCDYTLGRGARLDEKPPAYNATSAVFRSDVLKTIEDTVDHYDAELRELSLDIWKHPEIAWQEKYALLLLPPLKPLTLTICPGEHTTDSSRSRPRTALT